MELKVKRIHLTADSSINPNNRLDKGITDVIVYLENGKKFIASFFAYSKILDMKNRHQTDGSFKSGSYFWEKNMVLVENCTPQIIEPAVNDLIDEGNFGEAFREL
jgi:hypothetical protein